MTKCDICEKNYKKIYNLNATTKACLKCKRKRRRTKRGKKK